MTRCFVMSFITMIKDFASNSGTSLRLYHVPPVDDVSGDCNYTCALMQKDSNYKSVFTF